MASVANIPSDTVSPTTRALQVLGVCVVLNLIARGAGESFTVFLLPVSAEMGWSRAEITSVYAVFMIAHACAAPFVGLVFDRLGGRLTYMLGLVAYGSGFAITGAASELWQVYLGLGLLAGTGVTAMGILPATGLIGRWFERRLTTAMAVAHAGLGLGVIMIVPCAQWLIQEIGWRSTYAGMAIVLLALLPVVALLPWRRFEAGNPAIFKPRTETAGGGLEALRSAVRTVPFWSLFAVFFFTSISMFSISLQAIAYLIEQGLEPLKAAGAFAMMSLLSMAGMIGTGVLADRYGLCLTVTVTYVFTFIGIACLWMYAAAPSVILLMGFVVFFGLNQGARAPVVSTLIARLFERGACVVQGVASIGLGLGAGLGSWLTGMLYDMTGDYRAGFILAAVTASIGMAQFWLVKALRTGKREDLDTSAAGDETVCPRAA